ncbi:hypothetical protein QUF93_11810 [Bacillus hominis]|uniref:hypothetical protein n=1 Tax=Bacillus hominis TaxID=2817478 RepID=UPI0025A1279B|nr:hypothetical protein [Bacillus hominis]MDA1967651.1 hypothetical protein [Bacillus cereus]MDM5193240.1 hypothetical protein [Bacillus hominis]
MSTTDNPTPSTIKRLFALSGNQCAFPKCKNKLVEGKKVTGKICHIKARSEGGPRYDLNQDADERRGFDNLILMCPIHHDVIDSDVESYTVERLIALKKNHNNNPINEDEVSIDIVNQLILNMHIETKIQIQNEYQNNGQIANTIVNYYVPDIPTKNIRVSCRRLLINIENTIKDLKYRYETPTRINIEPIILPQNWEILYTDISDYLDITDSTTLITFFEYIIPFNNILKETEEYFRNSGVHFGAPLGDLGVSRLSRAYEGQLKLILDLDFERLTERLNTLGK